MSFDQLLVWFLGMVNIPFLVLVAMGWIIYDAIKTSHQAGKLDVANLFKDDNGKESGLRVAILGSLAISSWYLMADLVIGKAGNPWLFGLYLATWSAAPVFVKAIEKWDGSFKKG